MILRLSGKGALWENADAGVGTTGRVSLPAGMPGQLQGGESSGFGDAVWGDSRGR